MSLEETSASTTMTTLEGVPYLRHGSADSVDKDVAYFVPKLPTSIKVMVDLCSNTDENRNLFQVNEEEGVVECCFKGLPDELNNSLIHNYHVHKQAHPNPLKKRIHRIVPLKFARAVRSIITRFTRSYLRTQLKPILHSGNFSEYLRFLKMIDFTDEKLKESINDVESLKSLAFQMAQTILLCSGTEVFSKAEVYGQYPDLKPFMMRKLKEIMGEEESGESETTSSATTTTTAATPKKNGLDTLNKYRQMLVDWFQELQAIFIQNDETYLVSYLEEEEEEAPAASSKNSKKKTVQKSKKESKFFNAFFYGGHHGKEKSAKLPLLYEQCNGIIIDMKPGAERCLYYPIDNAIPGDADPVAQVFIFPYHDNLELMYAIVPSINESRNVSVHKGATETAKKLFNRQIDVQSSSGCWTKYYMVFGFVDKTGNLIHNSQLESVKPKQAENFKLRLLSARHKLTNEQVDINMEVFSKLWKNN